jgi:hypothetical protein
MAVKSKAWVYDLSLAAFAGTNIAGSMDLSLLSVVCYFLPLLRFFHALPSVVRQIPG